MDIVTSTSKLYELLSAKIGKQAAEFLLIFIDQRVLSEMEQRKKILATNENLFKVRGVLKEDINEVRAELKEEIGEVRAELKQEISEVRTELKQEISEIRTELKGDISAVRVELKDEAGGLRVHMEKGFRQQFWLIITLFLPFYFTLIFLMFRLF